MVLQRDEEGPISDFVPRPVRSRPRSPSRPHPAATIGEPRDGRCLLCGAGGGPIVLREDGYVGRTCPCGVVYVDPRPAAEHVDDLVDHHFAAYYSLPARLRVDWIRRFRGAGRLLEVGCGLGHFTAAARAAGYQVSAVEPDPERARHVSERLGIEVEAARVEDCRQPERSFDVVFHVDLLSHFPDPVLALRSMAARLKPDGVVCCEVGLVGGLRRSWYGWIGRPGFPHHRWFYSEKALRALFRRAGLEIVQMRRYGLVLSCFISTIGNRWFLRALPKPRPEGRGPREASGFYRFYCYLQYLLRYRVGRVLPPVGPLTAFVTARPLASGEVDGSA